MKVESFFTKDGKVEHLITATAKNEFSQVLLFNLESYVERFNLDEALSNLDKSRAGLITLPENKNKSEVCDMVKLSSLKIERKPVFEGKRTKLSKFVNKEISIKAVSEERDGEYGPYRIIQFENDGNLYTAIVNSNTSVYQMVEAIAEALKKHESVEAKVVQKTSKNKRKYIALV